jgi:hypothetical protein
MNLEYSISKDDAENMFRITKGLEKITTPTAVWVKEERGGVSQYSPGYYEVEKRYKDQKK